MGTRSVNVDPRSTAEVAVVRQGRDPSRRRLVAHTPPPHLLSLRINARTLAIFSRQLGAMVASGIPLFKGLTLLSETGEQTAWNELIGRIAYDVSAGRTFADAIRKYPNVFSPMYCATIHIGEVHGRFDLALSSVSAVLERDEKIVARLKGALTYPAIICLVALAAAFLIFYWLLPQFLGMFEELHVPLPLLTQILIVAMHVARSPITLLGGIPLTLLAMREMRRWIQTKEGRLAYDAFKLRLPGIGLLVRKVAIARLSQSLSVLLGSGIVLTQAVEVAASACGNEVIRADLMTVSLRVMDGDPLSKALARCDHADSLMCSMVAVGETSGRVDTMLARLADLYMLQVDQMLDSLQAMVEPALTVLIGGLVAVICLGIFLPMYGLIQHLGI
jgi:type IV pilus assembly protein PilC